MKKICVALVPAVAVLMFIPAIAGATGLSDLTAATASNTINNGNNAQLWTWNTLTSNVSEGISFQTNSTTAATGQTVLLVSSQGANSTSGVTTWNAVFDNSHTGTNSTNYGAIASAEGGAHNYGVQGNIQSTISGDAGVWGTVTGTTGAAYGVLGTSASSAGYAGYFNNTAGGYAAAFMGGNVGIGTATPQSLVHAYGGEVQVGSSGTSCAAANNGAIRFSSSTLYVCTGTTWTAIGGSGSGTVTSIATNNGITGGTITGSGTIGLATIANNTALANISGSTAAPTATPLSALQVAPQVTVYTSSSGTYTTPSNTSYLHVRMVGGGGGGAGSANATNNGGSGGTSGNTTFGTSLLVANGGVGAAGAGANSGGLGGTASLGSGPVGLAISGGQGGGSSQFSTGGISGYVRGGMGGSSAFGGAGGNGPANAAGGSSVTNSGSGGGGAGTAVANSTWNSGAGGGSGGYVEAYITSPAATYSYAVGAAGSAGSAGTGGYAGGAGGSGVIIVEAY